MKEEFRKQQKLEQEKLAAKLDQEARSKEHELKNQADASQEQVLREKRNRQAAELAARTDLSEEQLAAVSLTAAIIGYLSTTTGREC